jgi:hypothetical protein
MMAFASCGSRTAKYIKPSENAGAWVLVLGRLRGGNAAYGAGRQYPAPLITPVRDTA